MASIGNTLDIAATVRSRRRALGWDQATLAREVGVSRQWIIEIEKGKERAELDLVLRTLRALGLVITVTAAESASENNMHGDSPDALPQASTRDLDFVVEQSLDGYSSTPVKRSLSIVDALRQAPRTRKAGKEQ